MTVERGRAGVKRGYASTLRVEQALATRTRIVDGARRVFIREGYAASSMSGIAAECGVSRETLYKTFGTKPRLLKAIYDVAVVGDHDAVPVAQRADYLAMLAEPDSRTAARTFGRLSAALLGRIAPVLKVMADAGDEPALRDVVAQTRAERLAGARDLVSRLAPPGADAAALERAGDVVWALISPEVSLLLTGERGWSEEEYAEWLGESIAEVIHRL